MITPAHTRIYISSVIIHNITPCFKSIVIFDYVLSGYNIAAFVL